MPGLTPSSHQTGTLFGGPGTLLACKYAAINVAGAGANALVAAVASKKIRVISGMAMPAAASTATFKGTGGGAISGAMPGGFVLPYNPAGWCETPTGEGLDLFLSGAVNWSGFLTYVEVTP